jgi:predicted  nucleic acid-binding Zn-ribbon protein
MNDPINVPPAVLLGRIARLESLVTGLQKQLADQQTRCEDLSNALEINAASGTKHIRKLYEQIDTLDMQLLELIEKLYPGHARTQLQIINVLKGPQKPETENNI